VATARKSVEDILLDHSWVSPGDLEKAEGLRKPGQELGQVLVEIGALEPQRLAHALAQQYRLPFMAYLDEHTIDLTLVAKVPINYAKKNRLLPLYNDGSAVTLAVADPSNFEPFDDLRVLFGLEIDPVVSPPEVIAEAINRCYDRTQSNAQDLMIDLDQQGFEQVASELANEPRDLLESEEAAPVIKFVNSLLAQAAKDSASDIHIEAFERKLVVRFRVDGMLYDVVSPPKRFQAAIASRIKIMAGLNIAEKRLPQDGRIRFRLAGRDIDVRVSSLPTAFGERIVLRLLDRAQTLVELNLDRLGYAGEVLERLDRLIRQAHGIILVTGPTGSGKTTTLYASLSRINSPEKNIITIEDPIEYQLAGIGQMQVSPKINLTFANGLRSILRQDPDVIMVGEIRDGETADIAIHASLTGHLVFSTLHTNDSFGALTRLVDMGVEPFLVSSSVLAVIAQRLVRLVCPACREPYTPNEAQLKRMEVSDVQLTGPLYKARSGGCAQCRHTGYRGRSVIYEVMVMNDEIRSLVMRNTDASAIRRACVERGMRLLRQHGAERILAGDTTLEELMRVTQEEAV
jgi:general secretion pathway protein E